MSKRLLIAIPAFILLSSLSLSAQNLAGDWQGRLEVPGGGLRTILRITKSEAGEWKADMYSIDQIPDAIPVSSITLQGSDVVFTVDMLHGRFQGKLSADENSITGAWTQGAAYPLALRRATKETAWPTDTSPHAIQLVQVEKNVNLEVLDWGGNGRAIVLLAGLGSTAHDFDQFAPKLTPSYHVYGITRRGFGASSAPDPTTANYSADRLGDDVIAVIDKLKIERPVLVGHSIAGEELSSIGTRYESRIGGLVYLDAGYPYAYYDSKRGDLIVDLNELRNELDEFLSPVSSRAAKLQVKQLIEVSVPYFERDLHELQKQLMAVPDTDSAPPNTRAAQIDSAIQRGERKYTGAKCPVLAIFAVPHNLGSDPGISAAARAAMAADDLERTSAVANAFEAGTPSARVVRLANADHFIYRSNEAAVLREMNAFLAKLP